MFLIITLTTFIICGISGVLSLTHNYIGIGLVFFSISFINFYWFVEDVKEYVTSKHFTMTTSARGLELKVGSSLEMFHTSDDSIAGMCVITKLINETTMEVRSFTLWEKLMFIVFKKLPNEK